LNVCDRNLFRMPVTGRHSIRTKKRPEGFLQQAVFRFLIHQVSTGLANVAGRLDDRTTSLQKGRRINNRCGRHRGFDFASVFVVAASFVVATLVASLAAFSALATAMASEETIEQAHAAATTFAATLLRASVTTLAVFLASTATSTLTVFLASSAATTFAAFYALNTKTA